MAIDKLISADSHVVEPPDLWVERIDPKYRDRAPRMFREGSVDRWVVDKGTPAGSVGAPSQAGYRYEDPSRQSIEASYDNTPRAAFDPHERIKALEMDGVMGEVLFPTICARLYETTIPSDLLSACCGAYNNWAAEFAKPYPDITRPAGILNVDSVDEAVEELKRCRQMGLSVVTIPAYPGPGKTYDEPKYDALWAAAQDLGVPLAMHSGSYRPGPGVIGSFANDVTIKSTSSFRASEDYWPRRSLADMIFSGVFERFPRLITGAVEFELGWAAYFLLQMDRHYRDHKYVREIRFKSDKIPSDFFHQNVYVAFQEDFTGVPNRYIIGVDNIVWGSDYPHTESTWPHSRQVLSEVLAGVPQEEQEKIAWENAARLFGFSVN